MLWLAWHQLGSRDLLFTLLEELGEHQGLPEPGTSWAAPGDVDFPSRDLLRNGFIGGGRDLSQEQALVFPEPPSPGQESHGMQGCSSAVSSQRP